MAAAGYSSLCRGILRSKFYFHGYGLGAYGYDRMISSINSARSKVSPRLMLPPAFEGDNIVYQAYNLADDRVDSLNRTIKVEDQLHLKTVGCSHGWVALWNLRNGNLFLSNPLTCQHIKLPLIHTLCDPGDELRYFTIAKVVLSCSPSADEDEEECRAMMSYGFCSVANRLAFCLTGRSTHWTSIGKLEEDDEDADDYEVHGVIARGYGDMIYSAVHKLFFCIAKSNVFQVWDLQPRLQLSNWIGVLKDTREIRGILEKPEYRRHKYLVLDDRSNQLFFVRRHIMTRVGRDGLHVLPHYLGYCRGWDDSYPYKTMSFDVHKIDWDVKCGKIKVSYVEGDSLEGLAMFIGLNHSFALPAAEYPGLIPNSIYFTDDVNENTILNRVRSGHPRLGGHPRWVNRIYGGHDVGIFNYENKTFSPCYYPCDFQSIKKIKPSPVWFTSSPH